MQPQARKDVDGHRSSLSQVGAKKSLLPNNMTGFAGAFGTLDKQHCSKHERGLSLSPCT
jgi:hypothetical protein